MRFGQLQPNTKQCVAEEPLSVMASKLCARATETQPSSLVFGCSLFAAPSFQINSAGVHGSRHTGQAQAMNSQGARSQKMFEQQAGEYLPSNVTVENMYSQLDLPREVPQMRLRFHIRNCRHRILLRR
jgi:hypothetical protein